MDARIREAIENDQELQIRYHSAFDARAGDLKYHRYCMKTFVYVPPAKEVNNSIELKNLLDAGFFLSIEESLKDGQILSLADVVNSYDYLLRDHGIENCVVWTTKKKKMKDTI